MSMSVFIELCLLSSANCVALCHHITVHMVHVFIVAFFGCLFCFHLINMNRFLMLTDAEVCLVTSADKVFFAIESLDVHIHSLFSCYHCGLLLHPLVFYGSTE